MGLNQGQFAADNAHIKVVQDNSKLVAEKITSAVARGLEMIGIKAEGDVIGYITQEHIVDTGRLRNSITHAIMEDAGSRGAAAVVGTNVEYAKYVHNGTSRVEGRPFLVNPTQKNMSEYRDILKQAMQNG